MYIRVGGDISGIGALDGDDEAVPPLLSSCTWRILSIEGLLRFRFRGRVAPSGERDTDTSIERNPDVDAIGGIGGIGGTEPGIGGTGAGYLGAGGVRRIVEELLDSERERDR